MLDMCVDNPLRMKSFHVVWARNVQEYSLKLRIGKARVFLGLGSNDAVKVWLNGTLVHEHWVMRPVRKDDDLVQLDLQPGRNTLLLKVLNGSGGWGFMCRALGPRALEEKLISAASRGDLDTVKRLVDSGVAVNARTSYGLTALQGANIHGYRGIAVWLVANGADPQIDMRLREQVIDGIFNEIIGPNTPGAAVLVAHNAHILFKKGYGLANVEHRVPITPATKFRIGSISKQFTAAAILKLQEQGLLSVSDKLSQFIPGYPRGEEVTIHHLLTHTSGIRSYTSKPDFLKTVRLFTTPEELINSFKDDPYDFGPGRRWSYNNSGYFLLGEIIEKVSGASYGAFLKQQFFEPLGMHNTGVHQWNEILAHEAHGYSYKDGKLQKALNWDMSRAGGAGALYSTVEDLYRWNEALFTEQVLSEGSLKAAFAPVVTRTAVVLEVPYGYGWGVPKLRGLQEISHEGGLDGFNSFLLRLPQEYFTVVVLANMLPPSPGLNVARLSRDIAQLYLTDHMQPREIYRVDTTVSPTIFDTYVGRYDYGIGIVTCSREGDRLFAQLTGQQKFEIFPKSATEFFWKVVRAEVTFVKNDKGEVIKAIHRQDGRTIHAPKID
jgi:CubicO group peptidase (beta-lactamase class C family)